MAGAAPKLSYCSTSYLIRTLGDVYRLPVEFDFDALAEAHRHSFEQSGVRIARFLNVVYLVYRYVPAGRPPPSQTLSSSQILRAWLYLRDKFWIGPRDNA